MRLGAAVVLTAGLVAAALPSTAAAAPPPRLRPRPVPRAVRRVVPPPPAVRRALPGPVVRPVPPVRPIRPIVPPPRPIRPIVPPRVIGPRPILPVVPPLPRPVVVVPPPVVSTATVVTEVQEPVVVPAPQAAPSQAYQVLGVDENFLVKLSIDGVETPVRMLGVDAPQFDSGNGTPKTAEPALKFLQNLLKGEEVYLEHDPNLAEKDAEGNLVAYLYRAPDKLLVNLELVRQGLGLVSEGYEFEFQDEFNAYQQRAQALGKGIWGLVAGAAP